MNPLRKQRPLIVLGLVAGLGTAVGLVLYALSQNINLFYTPQQEVSGEAPEGLRMRVGGLVVDGSVRRVPGGLGVLFGLTDGKGAMAPPPGPWQIRSVQTTVVVSAITSPPGP